MNRITKLSVIAFTIIILIFGCKKADNFESMEETISAETISSSAAVQKEGSNRKFIRSADMKFKVKNVTQSTYAIENIATKFDGFVTYTNLQTIVHNTFETKISQDSLLETTRFNVENKIIIRVPNKRLDTVIKCIAKQIDFLDYRIIKADDVSLKIQSNKLTQERSSTSEKRVEKAIDSKGKKINDIIEAEKTLADKKEQNDNSKLENLSLQDQIDFSTITLEIYQQSQVKQELISNTRDDQYYKPNIFIRIFDAVKSGWYIMLDVIVFFFEIWWLLLFITGIIYLYRRFFKKNKS